LVGYTHGRKSKIKKEEKSKFFFFNSHEDSKGQFFTELLKRFHSNRFGRKKKFSNTKA